LTNLNIEALIAEMGGQSSNVQIGQSTMVYT